MDRLTGSAANTGYRRYYKQRTLVIKSVHAFHAALSSRSVKLMDCIAMIHCCEASMSRFSGRTLRMGQGCPGVLYSRRLPLQLTQKEAATPGLAKGSSISALPPVPLATLFRAESPSATAVAYSITPVTLTTKPYLSRLSPAGKATRHRSKHKLLYCRSE